MSGKARRDTLGIAEEAAEWLDALERGNAEVNAEFVKWLRTSPRHLEEFLLVTASDHACDALDNERKLDVDAMIAGRAENVVALKAEGPRVEVGRKVGRQAKVWAWHRAAGLAAVAAGLALAVAWSLGVFGGWRTYSAAVGEQRAVELADGSLIHLNARSRVKVRLSDDRRDIRLLEGEALFNVAHDVGRPFRVESGDALIRAVGTQFNVNRRAQGTRVAVIEGRVEITPTTDTAPASPQRSSVSENPSSAEQFSAGEEARIVQSGKIVRLKANLVEATAWRQRRLIFRDSTLDEIASEFNRYNRTPQFVIENDAVRTQRFGGTFDADEPGSLIAFLRSAPGLVIEHRGDEVVIREK